MINAVKELELAKEYVIFTPETVSGQEIVITSQMLMMYIAERLDTKQILAQMGLREEVCNIWVSLSRPELFKIIEEAKKTVDRINDEAGSNKLDL